MCVDAGKLRSGAWMVAAALSVFSVGSVMAQTAATPSSAKPAQATALTAATSANPVAQKAVPKPAATPASSTPQSAVERAAANGTRAQLVAVRHAVIASELAAKISRLPVREGQTFKQGETLVAYDCSLNRARLSRATQAEAAARSKLGVAEQLDKLGSISQADLVQARGAVSVAQAESSVERVMVQRCTITAPYAGRVGETYVREAEHVAEGKELLSIYDDSAFEVETIVPSRWLAWLKPDYPMRIAIDETGRTYEARIKRIAGTVDAISQSVKVVGRLTNAAGSGHDDRLRPGMSGTVRIDPPAP